MYSFSYQAAHTRHQVRLLLAVKLALLGAIVFGLAYVEIHLVQAIQSLLQVLSLLG